jgi:hypothetical protein
MNKVKFIKVLILCLLNSSLIEKTLKILVSSFDFNYVIFHYDRLIHLSSIQTYATLEIPNQNCVVCIFLVSSLLALYRLLINF